VRLGAEYAWFDDHYAGAEVKVPPVDAINHPLPVLGVLSVLSRRRQRE